MSLACAEAMDRWANELITVCDRCLKASCWQGVIHCEIFKQAGIAQMSRKSLAKLARESSDYWTNG